MKLKTIIESEARRKMRHLREQNSEFDGPGLVVVGRTPLDNNAIGDLIDDSDFTGYWNSREGYWFFPEPVDTADALERDLDRFFQRNGISVRFELQEARRKLSESISREAVYIHQITDAGQQAIQDFIDEYRIDAKRLADYVASIRDTAKRYMVRDMISGTGTNPQTRKRFIRSFQ